MKHQKLYKGKYLIALYDKYDDCVGVFVSAKEMGQHIKNISLSSIKSMLARNQTIKGYTVYLIDCYEKHNDIFKKEDEEFLKIFNQTRQKTIKEKSQELGISERQYYRRKQALKGSEKQNENKTI